MARSKTRVVVIYNRDFEGAEADPENRAREDIQGTAKDVVRILAARGFDARALGVTDDVPEAIRSLVALEPNVVFNLCESIHGDNRFEALLPMLLELEAIAYTGSPPLALSLALHKHKAKDVLRAHAVATPRGVCVDPTFAGAWPAALGDLRYPVIVKPTREDASVGVTAASVVHDIAAMRARVEHVHAHYRQPALVEEYIEGREIYVSVLAERDAPLRILPLFEIDFSDLPVDRPRIVTFEGKWVEDSPEYTGTRPVPCARLAPDIEARLFDTVRRGFAALELRDYARFDVRLAPDGTAYVIDVNPNCDLSELAGGYSRAARAAGMTYEELVLHILELALARRPHADTVPQHSRPKRDRTDDRPAARRPSPEPNSSGRDDAGELVRVPARGGVVRARASRSGA